MIEKIKEFFSVWILILIINQIIIGCFLPGCIIASIPHTAIITFLLLSFSKDDKEENKKDDFFNETNKTKKYVCKAEYEDIKVKQDSLKTKGNEYEKYIGKKFEEKGELVIYNGFIKGYEDKGVDLISINNNTYNINLIQCKNWTNKPIYLEDIQEIYNKLSQYDFDFFNLPIWQINKYLQLKKKETYIRNIIKNVEQNFENFTIRKTLYIGSGKVIDFSAYEHLTKIKPNIFRYKDMKIVIHKLERI